MTTPVRAVTPAKVRPTDRALIYSDHDNEEIDKHENKQFKDLRDKPDIRARAGNPLISVKNVGATNREHYILIHYKSGKSTGTPSCINALKEILRSCTPGLRARINVQIEDGFITPADAFIATTPPASRGASASASAGSVVPASSEDSGEVSSLNLQIDSLRAEITMLRTAKDASDAKAGKIVERERDLQGRLRESTRALQTMQARIGELEAAAAAAAAAAAPPAADVDEAEPAPLPPLSRTILSTYFAPEILGEEGAAGTRDTFTIIQGENHIAGCQLVQEADGRIRIEIPGHEGVFILPEAPGADGLYHIPVPAAAPAEEAAADGGAAAGGEGAPAPAAAEFTIQAKPVPSIPLSRTALQDLIAAPLGDEEGEAADTFTISYHETADAEAVPYPGCRLVTWHDGTICVRFSEETREDVLMDARPNYETGQFEVYPAGAGREDYYTIPMRLPSLPAPRRTVGIIIGNNNVGADGTFSVAFQAAGAAVDAASVPVPGCKLLVQGERLLVKVAGHGTPELREGVVAADTKFFKIAVEGGSIIVPTPRVDLRPDVAAPAAHAIPEGVVAGEAWLTHAQAAALLGAGAQLIAEGAPAGGDSFTVQYQPAGVAQAERVALRHCCFQVTGAGDQRRIHVMYYPNYHAPMPRVDAVEGDHPVAAIAAVDEEWGEPVDLGILPNATGRGGAHTYTIDRNALDSTYQGTITIVAHA